MGGLFDKAERESPPMVWSRLENPVCEEPFASARRQSQSLAALAVTLMLVVAGLYLIDALRAQAEFQDCVLSGRMVCL